MAHFAMSPMRWFPEVMDWMLGEENESPVYVQIIEDFGRWVFQEELMY